MGWETKVQLSVLAILFVVWMLSDVRQGLRESRRLRQVRERSPWLTGLLDAEAGEAVEPQDWDDEVSPGYWQEYAQGAFDYRRHLEERLP